MSTVAKEIHENKWMNVKIKVDMKWKWWNNEGDMYLWQNVNFFLLQFFIRNFWDEKWFQFPNLHFCISKPYIELFSVASNFPPKYYSSLLKYLSPIFWWTGFNSVSITIPSALIILNLIIWFVFLHTCLWADIILFY